MPVLTIPVLVCRINLQPFKKLEIRTKIFIFFKNDGNSMTSPASMYPSYRNIQSYRSATSESANAQKRYVASSQHATKIMAEVAALGLRWTAASSALVRQPQP